MNESRCDLEGINREFYSKEFIITDKEKARRGLVKTASMMERYVVKLLLFNLVMCVFICIRKKKG
jgi:hypothetical protein